MHIKGGVIVVRKIVDKVPDEVLQQDLKKYRQRVIELGATDAKIISTDMVVIDERVRAKCIYPKCTWYGTNAHCPPHALDLEQVRKIVNNFRYAIVAMIKITPEEMLGLPAKNKSLPARGRVKNYEIIGKIEAEAFFDGYHLALGFASGPCKIAFCPKDECNALIPGQPCRHPLRSRSSMEGAGIDAFTMAAKVGWDVYPIGTHSSPSEVPHGTRLGLVLIY